MRRASLGAAWVLLSALALVLALGPCVFAEAPERICSVSLAGDELLALLVPTERVACVSSFADDPSMSNVAGHYPDSVARVIGRIEPVLAARPDFVLVAPWNNADFLELLSRSGARSAVLDDIHGFESVRAELLRVGGLVGAEERAQRAALAFDARLSEVDALVSENATQPRLRVLSFSHLIVAGRETSVDALIERAGGRNAGAELGFPGHRKVSLERLIALDPDVLLLGVDAERDLEQILTLHPQLRSMRAVREGRVVELPPRMLTTVSPYLADAALELARSLAALEP